MASTNHSEASHKYGQHKGPAEAKPIVATDPVSAMPTHDAPLLFRIKGPDGFVCLIYGGGRQCYVFGRAPPSTAKEPYQTVNETRVDLSFANGCKRVSVGHFAVEVEPHPLRHWICRLKCLSKNGVLVCKANGAVTLLRRDQPLFELDHNSCTCIQVSDFVLEIEPLYWNRQDNVGDDAASSDTESLENPVKATSQGKSIPWASVSALGASQSMGTWTSGEREKFRNCAITFGIDNWSKLQAVLPNKTLYQLRYYAIHFVQALICALDDDEAKPLIPLYLSLCQSPASILPGQRHSEPAETIMKTLTARTQHSLRTSSIVYLTAQGFEWEGNMEDPAAFVFQAPEEGIFDAGHSLRATSDFASIGLVERLLSDSPAFMGSIDSSARTSSRGRRGEKDAEADDEKENASGTTPILRAATFVREYLLKHASGTPASDPLQRILYQIRLSCLQQRTEVEMLVRLLGYARRWALFDEALTRAVEVQSAQKVIHRVASMSPPTPSPEPSREIDRMGGHDVMSTTADECSSLERISRVKAGIEREAIYESLESTLNLLFQSVSRGENHGTAEVDELKRDGVQLSVVEDFDPLERKTLSTLARLSKLPKSSHEQSSGELIRTLRNALQQALRGGSPSMPWSPELYAWLGDEYLSIGKAEQREATPVESNINDVEHELLAKLGVAFAELGPEFEDELAESLDLQPHSLESILKCVKHRLDLRSNSKQTGTHLCSQDIIAAIDEVHLTLPLRSYIPLTRSLCRILRSAPHQLLEQAQTELRQRLSIMRSLLDWVAVSRSAVSWGHRCNDLFTLRVAASCSGSWNIVAWGELKGRKPASNWGPEHDRDLLRGTLRHGLGHWELLRSDPTLSLAALAASERQMPSASGEYGVDPATSTGLGTNDSGKQPWFPSIVLMMRIRKCADEIRAKATQFLSSVFLTEQSSAVTSLARSAIQRMIRMSINQVFAEQQLLPQANRTTILCTPSEFTSTLAQLEETLSTVEKQFEPNELSPLGSLHAEKVGLFHLIQLGATDIAFTLPAHANVRATDPWMILVCPSGEQQIGLSRTSDISVLGQVRTKPELPQGTEIDAPSTKRQQRFRTGESSHVSKTEATSQSS